MPLSNDIILSGEQYDELLRINTNQQQEINNLKIDVLYYKQEIDKLKRLIFGQKSERFVSSTITESQLPLPFEVEVKTDPDKEVETETITYTRPKGGKEEKQIPVRLPLPAHLPRIEITIEPAEDISGAKKIGENITEILEYTPGKLYVKRFIRPKYVLPEDQGIVTGELPTLPIPRGNAGPGLLTHLIISKYVDHLPFYRQIQQFKRQGVEIAESTIIDWFNASCRLLEPLYARLRQHVQGSDYLMGDETPIKVLTRDKPGSTHKGYHWVYYSPLEKLVCFEYQKGRGREGPKKFLENFKGSFQCDGYNAYDMFENRDGIILLACMAHARRKFDESLNNDPALASQMMEMIRVLYDIERKAGQMNLSFEERKALREKESVLVLKMMEEWLKDQQLKVLPKSSIGQAVNYTLGLWHRLMRYVDDGRYEIDNNLIENSIRPVALGRKNYLFAGSHEAAQRAAMIYSLFGTCKQNNIEPYKWFSDVLERLPDCKMTELDQLLPPFWQEKTC
jgi:transposase